MKQYLKPPVYWFCLLALVTSFTAKAQSGEGYYGPATSKGNVSHGVGTGVQAFSIATGGSYDGFTYGIGVDNFIGPNGAPGAQEIGGIVAPIFDTLKLNNGATSAFNITNTAGILVNGGLAYNNGITTTLRANRAVGLAAAIQFLGTAVYTPALTPAIGTDLVFTDGFVSKVNPVAFVYPVGNVTDLRPITVTGTGTFATAWNNVNVATPYPYLPSNLPTGTSAINTNGYWEWSATAAATATLSIPDESSFTTAGKLSVMAYDGTNWTNLGGVFATNTENSTNTAAVTVPATTQALAIGQTVPYVKVSANAFLMGAMSGTSMVSSLNALLPLAQPYNNSTTNYAGTELLSAIPVSMVDWILVDIRDSITPTTIVATKAALLTTDGSITDVFGNPVTFLNVTPGNYYVGLRHRNHLAIRSASKIALTPTTTVTDFRTSIATVYTNPGIANAPMKDMGNGKFAMWAGDVNGDGFIKFSGPNNDKSALLVGCLSGNPGTVLNGFNNCDINLDGSTKFSGPSNDKSFLLVNALAGNTGLIITQHL